MLATWSLEADTAKSRALDAVVLSADEALACTNPVIPWPIYSQSTDLFQRPKQIVNVCLVTQQFYSQIELSIGQNFTFYCWTCYSISLVPPSLPSYEWKFGNRLSFIYFTYENQNLSLQAPYK